MFYGCSLGCTASNSVQTLLRVKEAAMRLRCDSVYARTAARFEHWDRLAVFCRLGSWKCVRLFDSRAWSHFWCAAPRRTCRLWGQHGQQALGECKICCINASAVGAEILKNLVLPGMFPVCSQQNRQRNGWLHAPKLWNDSFQLSIHAVLPASRNVYPHHISSSTSVYIP